MKKFVVVIRKTLFALKVTAQALIAPIVLLVKKSARGEPITIGELGFAAWRLLVWMTFLICATGSIGVPAIIAYLLLADLLILGIQTVFFAIA